MRAGLAVLGALLFGLSINCFSQEQEYAITSFTVSPPTAVSLSNQIYTVSVSISRSPGNENSSVVVQVVCQANPCGTDLGFAPGVSSAQGNFSPPAVATNTSDTLVATVNNNDGTLSDTKSTGIGILANAPTATFSSHYLFGSTTSVQATLGANLPDDTSYDVDFQSSPNGLASAQLTVPYGGNSASGNAFAIQVTEPTNVTLTPYLWDGSIAVFGNPVSLTIVPSLAPYNSEPSLPCPPGQCQGQAGSPINLTNGNVWITQQDYSLPGIAGGLSLIRTWNSLWLTNDTTLPASGMFGSGWRSTYEEFLHVIDQNNVKYVRANGDGWYLGWNSAAQNYQVLIPQNQHATLTYSGSTLLYTLTFLDGTSRIFNAGGQLTKIIDRNGNTTTVAYDGSSRISTVTDPANRVITFSYTDPDNTNQATSVADSLGTIATYTYDSSSRLTSVTYPDGSANTFTYDGNGQSLITSVLDGQGKVLEAHTYDSARRGLTSSRANGVDAVTVSYPSSGSVTLTDSFSNSTSYGYQYYGPIKFVNSVVGPTCHSCGAQTSRGFTFDSNGNETSSTDALGNVTNYTYDANGNKLSQSTQLANGSTPAWNYTYNSFQEVLTATDPLNNTTTNVYDAKGNLLTTTTPSPDGVKPGSTTTFTYNTNGTLKTIKDPLGNTTTLTYYTTGLLDTIKDANSKITTYVYDGRGNRLSIQDPLNGATKLTKFTYDPMNRLTSITYPGATTAVQFHYDYRGRRDYVIDQNSNKTSYGYDDADRLISVTDAQSPTPGVTQYAYDTESNLTSITDASNRQTIFTYDPERRLTQTKFPSLLLEGYGYDADNNLISKTDRNNQTIQYAYDALSNLLSKTYPDSSTVTYTYDLASRLTQVQDPTGTYAFTYDNMNRLTQAGADYSFDSAGNLTVNYGYDAASNRTSMTDPQNLATAYTYDTLNRLSTLAFNGQSPAFGFGYDALSRRTSLTRPNGVDTTYAYDPISRLTSILHKLGTTTIDGATYTYDNAGNRKTRTDKRLNSTLTYGYDNIYQLLSAKQGSTTKETYTYDLVGNRLSSLGVSPYSYNSSNELTALPSGGYTYDANGNTLTDSTGRHFTWDIENRLTQVVLPGTGGTVNFKYDPFGRRIQKAFTQNGTTTTTNYVYDGDNLLEDLDQSGNILARYMQAISIDEPVAELRSGTTSYYQADGLGSVTSLSSSTGTLANTYSYDSFGKLTASSGAIANPFQYTGRELDPEIGIYYYRARYDDEGVGRFISEDPLRFGSDTNFYRYLRNSPASLVDPWGLSSMVFDRAGGVLILYGADGTVVAICKASNRPIAGRAPWPNGNYPYAYHNSHPEDPGPNGAYGSYGIDVFKVPGRTGMGVHSGRANTSGADAKTKGCIRTSDNCMKAITDWQAQDPLTDITVE